MNNKELFKTYKVPDRTRTEVEVKSNKILPISTERPKKIKGRWKFYDRFLKRK